MTMDPLHKKGLRELQQRLKMRRLLIIDVLYQDAQLNVSRKRELEGEMYGLNSCLTILSTIIMDDTITKEEIEQNAKLQ